MNKVIIISGEAIKDNIAGTAARSLNIANELSLYFKVIVFAPEGSTVKRPYQIEVLNKKKLKVYAKDASCIIVQGLTLWKYPFIKRLKIPLVVDIYNQFFLEQLEANKDVPFNNYIHRSIMTIIIDQLKCGDYFVCASQKQRDLWIGMLSSLNRINPVEYRRDPTLKHLIGIVPFGLPDHEPEKTKNVLKGVYPGINRSDKVIIWGGGLWDWLDPTTVIKAISIISQNRNDVKLFFMGYKAPGISTINIKAEESIKLSDQLGLTGKFVFFNEWVKYDDRQNYLLESDIGISLHAEHLETCFSFRTRILDYIWCNLPIICTKGDIMSEFVERHKLGIAVNPYDVDQVADAIGYMLDSPVKNENFLELKRDLQWRECVKPLISFCNMPEISKGKKEAFKISSINSRFNYYLIKCISIIKNNKIKGNKLKYIFEKTYKTIFSK